MSKNVDVVRAIYEAGKVGDLNAMLQHLDPQVKCHEASSLPYGGEYEGHEGFSRLMSAVFSVFEAFAVEVKELIDGGETVVAILEFRVTHKGSGRVVEMPIAEVWRLRDGKVVDLRPFYWDTAQLALSR